MSWIIFRYLRRKFWRPERFVPRTLLARLTALFIGFDLLFRLLAWTGKKQEWGASFQAWTTFLNFVVAILALFLLWHWGRQVVLWRLRNRLIITYIFIGVIPLALVVLMSGIAGYLFTNQFAVSNARSDIDAEVQELKALNSAVSVELSRELAKQRRFSGESLASTRMADDMQRLFPGLSVVFWIDGKAAIVRSNPKHPPLTRPEWLKETFAGLISDRENDLDLRSFSRTRVNGIQLEVITSAPLSDAVLNRAAAKLGQLSLYLTEPTQAGQTGVHLTVKDSNEVGKVNSAPFLTTGTIPPPSNALDRQISTASVSPAIDWDNGKQIQVFMQLKTRPSVMIARLFEHQGDFAKLYIFLLDTISVVFGFIVLFALFIGMRLTKTITGSVASLYEATQHINRGDLRHRIPVTRKDQLAALESAFNSMSESLERLLLEQKEKERLQSELSIAQEVQAQLFPRDSFQLPGLELHGFCRPARSVSGDYYDFLKLGPERLGIAVGDISGKGISAALLMATIHSAVRAYEFGRMPEHEELVSVGAAAAADLHLAKPGRNAEDLRISASPAETLWLLNRHLYHSTPPEKYATLFLATFDASFRSLVYSNAGHLPPLILSADGSIHKLESGGMVIGLFDNIEYEEAKIILRPGDIFVAYSDGVTEPENEFGEFGEERLVEIISSKRHLPLLRVSEIAVAAVQDWIGEQEQPDDITLVLARIC